ncbi:glycosyl hydrolase [Sediminitomix flava]|uniref:Glycosyl hydrolase family 26 n=1 Tax=Sediminitomix flava TaxID=379075 RepID=A0A315ZX65_SEDFL|nr:glycosyl hydrolase [Sediminitomix flava]PWJ41917.1 glycosyl hydrolase family 26 [Sediminitomix flava]
MSRLKVLALFLLSLSIWACGEQKEQATLEASTDERPRAKFEPSDGEVILFAGQSLAALGGLDEYNDGYLDHFETPGGFTMYTKILPPQREINHKYELLPGLVTTDDWGDGPNNMQLQIDDTDFQHSALAIGLELVDYENATANGEMDSMVIALGEWIKGLGNRPVFLRIGYEFDGHDWNHYDREGYLGAYKRIYHMYDSMQIDNIAYVWQSTGWGSSYMDLKDWYPGDEYVDWCAYSHFARHPEAAPLFQFARDHKKPVMIAEATPTLPTETIKTDGKTKETKLDNPTQAQEALEQWFKPFFQVVYENEDVVKAIHYINTDWHNYSMWKTNPTFQDIDARLQLNQEIKSYWIEETSKPKYLKASPDLFSKLWGIEE